MGACWSKKQVQGNFPSLPLPIQSIHQVAGRVSLASRPPIEKPDRPHSKLSLSSDKISSYGPTITRLAVKLWQTKDGIR
jgi:hypothetical protein